MSDIVIRAENLSKQYHIGKRQEKYPTLRAKLANSAVAPFRRASKLLRGQATGAAELDETIWALRDISFEIARGEVVGIVGPNGAGKSTLLKILSHITEPTSGFAVIRGRVRSLLEVGTGFHQELTGRENVYLNGAILGMKRVELDRKFDEIVAFADVEKFLDTPVKHYSSGMQVRLGFAVAAHLEPEILIVDEVLAVGDADFRRKCLEKMGKVAKEGRTVLFVSHNMIAVQSLCQRAIWLYQGQIKEDGEVAQVISDYLHLNASLLTEQTWDDIETAPGNGIVRLHRVCVRPKDGFPSDPITMQTPFVIEVEYWNQVPDTYLYITLHVYTEQQVIAFGTNSSEQSRTLPTGLFRSVCHVPGNLLNSGLHRVFLYIVKDKNSIIFQDEDVLSFEVLDLAKREGTWYGKRPGAVRPMLEWTTEPVGSAAAIEQGERN